MKRTVLLVGLILVTSSGLTACGKGGGDNLAAACKDNVAVQLAFPQVFASVLQGGPSSAPPTNAQKQQIKTRYDQMLAQPIADSQAKAPKAIKNELTAAAETLRNLAATGDPSAFNDPATSDKLLKVDNYFYDHCSGPKQAVSAKEYQYSGMPDRLPAGVLQLKMTNTGKEDHEMKLVVRKPGVTMSFDQILALPRGQARQNTDTVFQVSTSPGQSDANAVKLVPGQYLLLCSFSQGSNGQTQGNGPPHFTLGMKKEFTVR